MSGTRIELCVNYLLTYLSEGHIGTGQDRSARLGLTGRGAMMGGVMVGA